jgi:hypothetical protein
MPTRRPRRAAARRSTAARAPAGWNRLVESATLARRAGNLEKAQDAFRALSPADQAQLVRELVETRRTEITRAYVDVISVSAGYRLRRDEAGVRNVEPEACVILVVKKKWAETVPGPAERRVPTRFFAFATVDGERVLCAVPTDVEDSSRLARIRPQGPIEAAAPDKTPLTIPGAVACAIRRDGDDAVYIIGCRHVFGMALILDAAGHYAAEIRLFGRDTVVARATPLAGPLVNGLEFSFDSHLARVVDPGSLEAALAGVHPETRAQNWGDLRPGVDYWIITSHGRVRARFAAIHTDPIRYTSDLHDVRHFQLARFLLPDGPTVAGDSGSPVMTETGMLLGMHIAGDAADTSLMLPAWQLFHAPWYGATGESWDLWRPRSRRPTSTTERRRRLPGAGRQPAP